MDDATLIALVSLLLAIIVACIIFISYLEMRMTNRLLSQLSVSTDVLSDITYRLGMDNWHGDVGDGFWEKDKDGRKKVLSLEDIKERHTEKEKAREP